MRCCRAAGELPSEPGTADLAGRFRAERAERLPSLELVGLEQINRPEPARVVERQAAVCVGHDQQMVVLFLAIMIDPPAPGHAKVEDQRIAAVGMDEAVFGSAAEAGDLCPGEPLAEVDGK